MVFDKDTCHFTIRELAKIWGVPPQAVRELIDGQDGVGYVDVRTTTERRVDSFTLTLVAEPTVVSIYAELYAHWCTDPNVQTVSEFRCMLWQLERIALLERIPESEKESHRVGAAYRALKNRISAYASEWQRGYWQAIELRGNGFREHIVLHLTDSVPQQNSVPTGTLENDSENLAGETT